MCPKCGNPTIRSQVANVVREECRHCGPLPWATDAKTGNVLSMEEVRKRFMEKKIKQKPSE